MEKGCGSTIWRTYKSEVRGKPERLRRDDPTNPWVSYPERRAATAPRSRNTRPAFLSRKRQGGVRKAAVAAGVRTRWNTSQLAIRVSYRNARASQSKSRGRSMVPNSSLATATATPANKRLGRKQSDMRCRIPRWGHSGYLNFAGTQLAQYVLSSHNMNNREVGI